MTVTHYIWDELSDNVLMETDEAGDAIAVYTQEPGLYGSVVSQNREGTEGYYHFDGQGSTRQVTDASEVVTDDATYAAFGTEVAKSGSTENPWGYKGAAGYSSSPRTAKTYVRSRVLASALSRWLSPDPMAQDLNAATAYLYAENNPIHLSDPSGLVAEYFKPSWGTIFLSGVPWRSVGRDRERAVDDPSAPGGHRIIPPDPYGLKKGEGGRTVPVKYTAECICTCTDAEQRMYSLKCAVVSWLEIRIQDKDNYLSVLNYTLRGTYWHEVLHVVNLLGEATRVSQMLAVAENEGPMTKQTCEALLTAKESEAKKALDGALQTEEQHQHPEGPSPGKMYKKPQGVSWDAQKLRLNVSTAQSPWPIRLPVLDDPRIAINENEITPTTPAQPEIPPAAPRGSWYPSGVARPPQSSSASSSATNLFTRR